MKAIKVTINRRQCEALVMTGYLKTSAEAMLIEKTIDEDMNKR